MPRPRGIMDAWKLGGPIAAQHPTYKGDDGGLSLGERAGLHFVRVHGRRDGENEGGQRIYSAWGDWLGLSYWPHSPREGRGHGAWANAWPGRVEGVIDSADPTKPPLVFARPVFNKDWSKDARFALERVYMAPGSPKPFEGQGVVVLDSTDEEVQELIAYPADGALVAHWRGEDPSKLSSILWDADDDGNLDEDWRRGLDALMRIEAHGVIPEGSVDPLLLKPRTIALNMTAAVPDGGHLYMYGTASPTPADSGAPSIPHPAVAVGSIEAGGAFGVGYGHADVHKLGVNAEGLPIVPLHLSTEVPRHPPGPDGFTKDGPQFFELTGTPPRTELPIKVFVHHTFDDAIGKWVWWSTSEQQPPMGAGGTGSTSGGDPDAMPQYVRGAQSPNEQVFTSALFVPQATNVAGEDLRYAGDITPAELERLAQSPGVVRVEALGRHDGDDWIYAEDRDNPSGRNACGSAQGVLAFMPPNRDAQSFRNDFLTDGSAAEILSGVALLGCVPLYFGKQWNPGTGLPVNAWEMQQQSDDGLRLRKLAADGTHDTAGVFTIGNPVPRKPIRWNVRAVSANASANFGDSMECTNAITITLPEINNENIGQEAVVSNENAAGSGTNVTVQGFNGTEGMHDSSTSATCVPSETQVWRARSATQWRLS